MEEIAKYKKYSSEYEKEVIDTAIVPRGVFAKRMKQFLEELPKEDYQVEFRGTNLTIKPGILPPDIDTPFFTRVLIDEVSKCVQTKGSCRFFEMGVGSGATTIQIANIEGAIAYGVDINEDAVNCALLNAKNNNSRITAHQSNLFAAVDRAEKFDMIYWSIPLSPDDTTDIEKDIRYRIDIDPGHQIVKQFLEQAPSYLLENGVVILGADSYITDTKALKKIFEELNYQYQELAAESYPYDDMYNDTYIIHSIMFKLSI